MFENLGYFAFLAPVLLFWQSSRTFVGQIFSFFIRNDKFQAFHSNHFIGFLQKECKEIKFGNLIYKNYGPYVKKHKTYLDTLFIFRKQYIFLYKKFIPILIKSQSYNKLSVIYPNIFNFQKLLIDYQNYYHNFCLDKIQENKCFTIWEIKGVNSKEINLSSGVQLNSPSSIESNNTDSSAGIENLNYEVLSITPPIGFNLNELSSCESYNTKSKYYFSKEGTEILSKVESWLHSKDWYSERQIRWYMGCLLYGQPGTGKSALVLEIARKLKLHVSIFDLLTLNNQEFSKELERIPFGSIILIEDIDAVFNGRNNLSKNKQYEGLSFDCLINKLSGVNAIKNCFLFITTNHIDKLDPALIREGRLDIKMEIPPLCKEGKRFIAEKMLDLWPELIDEVVNLDKEETVAVFEARVTELALQKFWNKE